MSHPQAQTHKLHNVRVEAQTDKPQTSGVRVEWLSHYLRPEIGYGEPSPIDYGHRYAKLYTMYAVQCTHIIVPKSS